MSRKLDAHWAANAPRAEDAPRADARHHEATPQSTKGWQVSFEAREQLVLGKFEAVLAELLEDATLVAFNNLKRT